MKIKIKLQNKTTIKNINSNICTNFYYKRKFLYNWNPKYKYHCKTKYGLTIHNLKQDWYIDKTGLIWHKFHSTVVKQSSILESVILIKHHIDTHLKIRMIYKIKHEYEK